MKKTEIAKILEWHNSGTLKTHEAVERICSLFGVSTSTDIKVGNIVKLLPKSPASWIGVVTEIKNDEETKRHGHSGDVYIVQDPFSTVSISTRKENLLKGEFA